MNAQLQKDDILGHRIVRIMQAYQLIDSWIHFAAHYFVLDTGAVFGLPFDVVPGFQAIELPADAEEISSQELSHALLGLIDRVMRPRGSNDHLEADSVMIHLDSGYWLSQCSSAPDGVQGSVGIWFYQSLPDDGDELIDFWN